MVFGNLFVVYFSGVCGCCWKVGLGVGIFVFLEFMFMLKEVDNKFKMC